MAKLDSEFNERLTKFTEETGLTEAEIMMATDDPPPYSDAFIQYLDDKGISPQEHRKEAMTANMDALVTDKSAEAIGTLKGEVGFSTNEIAAILEGTRDTGEVLLEAMTENPSLRDLQLLTKVADVPPGDIVDQLKGQNVESRLAFMVEGGLADLVSSHFPDADWRKHDDVDTTQLGYDDPVIKDIVGEPQHKRFTEKIAEREQQENNQGDIHR